MQLSDIVGRQLSPEPWDEGEKIPWNDPAFSERMLAEHLTQAADYRGVLTACGFEAIVFQPALGEGTNPTPELIAITARKPAN